jgi:hypothetical protein
MSLSTLLWQLQISRVIGCLLFFVFVWMKCSYICLSSAQFRYRTYYLNMKSWCVGCLVRYMDTDFTKESADSISIRPTHLCCKLLFSGSTAQLRPWPYWLWFFYLANIVSYFPHGCIMNVFPSTPTANQGDQGTWFRLATCSKLIQCGCLYQ